MPDYIFITTIVLIIITIIYLIYYHLKNRKVDKLEEPIEDNPTESSAILTDTTEVKPLQ